MSTVKEQATELVEHLPDHATWHDLMYQIYVREKVASGSQEGEEGQARRRESAEQRDGLPSGETRSGKESTFARRWRGKFVAADREDERYKALARRYL